jgi:hypothetical protein
MIELAKIATIVSHNVKLLMKIGSKVAKIASSQGALKRVVKQI